MRQFVLISIIFKEQCPVWCLVTGELLCDKISEISKTTNKKKFELHGEADG